MPNLYFFRILDLTMLLPIRTNVWPRRTPYMNYFIIAANVVIFIITYQPDRYGNILRPWADKLMLHPEQLQWFQFVSYAFLHGGKLHLIGNMFFLYLFGNNICDKFGSIKYLLFYLASAIASAAGHMAIEYISNSPGYANPLLGASGAVAAVTGAFLVLYPKTLITVLYFLFIFIGTVEIPAMYFIAIKMIIIDNNVIYKLLGIPLNTDNIAYNAHLAGYAFGAGISMLLLATKTVTTSGFDMWSMLKQWNRRRVFRDTVAKGYDPFATTMAKKIKSKQIPKTKEEREKQQQVEELRTNITRRITQKNLPAAADLYLEMMNIDNMQILPKQQMLDIANQLASESKHHEAAYAYEKFIKNHPDYQFIEQIQLMLGIIYSRYLKQTDLAIKHLEKAKEKLADPDQYKMCKNELEKLNS